MDRHHMTARLHLQPSSAAVVQPKYYGNRCFREANAAYHSWRLAAARPEYWRRWVTLGSDIVRRPTHESRSVATTESASAADSHRAETMNSVDYKPHDNHKFLTHSGKHHKDYHLNIHLHLGELEKEVDDDASTMPSVHTTLFESFGTVSYSTSLVTVALSRIVLEIKRDIGRKSRQVGSRRNIYHTVWYGKTRMVSLTHGEETVMICLAISTEYRRVTDDWADRQTSCHDIVRTTHMCRAVKMALNTTKCCMCTPLLLLLVCVTWAITGQPRNSIFIRRM